MRKSKSSIFIVNFFFFLSFLVIRYLYFYLQSKGQTWDDTETYSLLAIWCHKNIQEQFKGTRKHKLIYQKIAEKHKLLARYDRDYKAIKNKIANLIYTYKLKKPKSGKYTSFIYWLLYTVYF